MTVILSSTSSQSREYDPRMIRDFVTQLTCELKIRFLENTNPSEVDHKLASTLSRLLRKRRNLGMLPLLRREDAAGLPRQHSRTALRADALRAEDCEILLACLDELMPVIRAALQAIGDG